MIKKLMWMSESVYHEPCCFLNCGLAGWYIENNWFYAALKLTFCPVVQPETVRSEIALACKGFKAAQDRHNNSLPYRDLKEEVYIKQPDGFAAEGHKHLVCWLKKSLHGLKQAPRVLEPSTYSQLKTIGFKQSTSDPCIYTSNTADGLLILTVYVDDILLAGKSEQRSMKSKLSLDDSFSSKTWVSYIISWCRC